ncbi:MAG: hypothetical protein NT051_04310 [Candidatus Micrarchaeota archaeon]|nr:hypothetical protein [Candidatus Micrarchaeota archaeon]
MPGFSQLNFRQYMEYSAGKQNSTLLRLAALYSDLAAANEKMDSERLTSQTSAQTAISRLSIEIQSLSKENLELIGDSRQSASSPATVSVGTEYSGINSALDAASLDLDRAKNEISLSRLAADSKSEDYLAEAISRAHAANGIAENALLSASGIRSDSESAIAYQQELARSAISRADSLVSQTPISIPTSLAHTEGALPRLASATRAFQRRKGWQTNPSRHSTAKPSRQTCNPPRKACANSQR